MHWPCSHVYSDSQSESETHDDECLCSCHSLFVLVVSSFENDVRSVAWPAATPAVRTLETPSVCAPPVCFFSAFLVSSSGEILPVWLFTPVGAVASESEAAARGRATVTAAPVKASAA